MLAKSQARNFFLVATVGFSAIFLGLTVDTLRQAPARSNQAAMTEQVVRGKEIWDGNNCMGCHTILGEGAYYAPELTKVVERRGAAWIDIFLQDPEAMFPGRRRMVKYDFTAEQRQDIIAFLGWVGNIDTNGFPAPPDLAGGLVATAKAATPPPSDSPPPPEMFTTVCSSCHALAGQGGNVGPALDGVGSRRDAEWLRAWLADPAAIKPDTTMPKLPMTPEVHEALVTFLSAQQ